MQGFRLFHGRIASVGESAHCPHMLIAASHVHGRTALASACPKTSKARILQALWQPLLQYDSRKGNTTSADASCLSAKTLKLSERAHTHTQSASAECLIRPKPQTPQTPKHSNNLRFHHMLANIGVQKILPCPSNNNVNMDNTYTLKPKTESLAESLFS